MERIEADLMASLEETRARSKTPKLESDRDIVGAVIRDIESRDGRIEKTLARRVIMHQGDLGSAIKNHA